MITIDLLKGWQKMFTPKKPRKIKKRKKMRIIKLTRAELNFLKGFSEIEIDKYLIEYPKRKLNTLEFKRRYRWVAGLWRKKI